MLNYRWMDKEIVVYTHTGILCCSKKEKNHVIHSNIDGTKGYQTEWSPSEKYRYRMLSITYGT